MKKGKFGRTVVPFSSRTYRWIWKRAWMWYMGILLGFICLKDSVSISCLCAVCSHFYCPFLQGSIMPLTRGGVLTHLTWQQPSLFKGIYSWASCWNCVWISWQKLIYHKQPQSCSTHYENSQKCITHYITGKLFSPKTNLWKNKLWSFYQSVFLGLWSCFLEPLRFVYMI